MNWAGHYWHGVPCMKARVEDLARRCEGKVLEVGANDGFVTQCIRERGLDVTALELSLEAIAKAKEQFGEDFPIQQGDIQHLPFNSNTFDTVVAGEVLEHLENPGLGLAELFRVCKPEGKVVLSLPIGHYWLGEPTHVWEIQGLTVDHDQGLLRPVVKELLILEWKKRRTWRDGRCENLPGWTYDPAKPE